MELLATIATVALVVAAVALSTVAYALTRPGRTPRTVSTPPEHVDARVEQAEQREQTDQRRANEQITPPPTIDGVTLRQYLVHMDPTEANLWPRVVADFYGLAASNSAVASYFPVDDEGRMTALMGHFTKAAILVSGSGVTLGLMRTMAERHARVRDRDGRPIDSATWDAVVSALVAVLTRYNIPGEYIRQLGQTIAPLRDVIVQPDPRHARR